MNKKDIINPFFVMIVGVIIFGAIAIYFVEIHNKALNKACQELGYEEFEESSIRSFSFCKDINGNLYYVEITDHFFNRVKLKEISVGDVRVLGGNN